MSNERQPGEPAVPRPVVLDQVNIVVRDMAAMAAFYRRLGVDLVTTPEWAPHHRSSHDGSSTGMGIDLDLDSPQFAVVWNRGWPGGSGIVLGFRVADRASVDRLHRELTEAGHSSQQPPYDTFWGARYAVVADPDGNSVGLMSPADDAHRSASPAPPAS